MDVCRRCHPFLCGLRDRSPAACWLWTLVSFGASLFVMVACICTTLPVVTLFSQPQILHDPNPHCSEQPSDYFGGKSITALSNAPICDQLRELPDAYLTADKCNTVYNVFDFDTSVASTPPAPPHAETIYLFIPGHAGSWAQGRWLANQLVELQRATHVYSIDTNGELGAFNSALLLDQIDYVSLVVARLAVMFPTATLTMVGHSYGGVVAANVPRTMEAYKLDAPHIKQMFTLGSPLLHNTLPLIDMVAHRLYSDLKADYKQSAARWSAMEMYNIAGGFRDTQIEAQDTCVDWGTKEQYHTHYQLTTDILGWGSLSHDELTYCQRLLTCIAMGGCHVPPTPHSTALRDLTDATTSIAIPAGVCRTYIEQPTNTSDVKLHYVNRLPYIQQLQMTHPTSLLYEATVFRQVWLNVNHLPQQIFSVFCLIIATLPYYQKQLLDQQPSSFYVREVWSMLMVIAVLHKVGFLGSRELDWFEARFPPLEVTVAGIMLYITAVRLVTGFLSFQSLFAVGYNYIRSKLLLIRRLREYCYSLQPNQVRRVVAIVSLSYIAYLLLALILAPVRRLYLTEVLTKPGSYFMLPLSYWLILSVEPKLLTTYNLLYCLTGFYQFLIIIPIALEPSFTGHKDIAPAFNGSVSSLRALQSIPSALVLVQLGLHCLQPPTDGQRIQLGEYMHAAYFFAGLVLMQAGTSMMWPITMMYVVNLTLLPSSIRICTAVLRRQPARERLPPSMDPVVHHFAGSDYEPLALDDQDTPIASKTPTHSAD